MHRVPALAPRAATALAHLAVPDDGDPSAVPKNSWCSRRTTSGPSSSLTMKVMLIADAPWEIISTLVGLTALNTRAASPGVFSQPDADHGDDGASLVDPDLAQIRELAPDEVEAGAVLDGERDAHLAARQHVHHDFVALEHLEELPEEAVGAEHPGRPDVDDRDSLLPRDRADR